MDNNPTTPVGKNIPIQLSAPDAPKKNNNNVRDRNNIRDTTIRRIIF